MANNNLPKIGEFVNVVDNKTMKIVGSGKLTVLTREMILIEWLYDKRYTMNFDARAHHFKGYEPPTMLIKK